MKYAMLEKFINVKYEEMQKQFKSRVPGYWYHHIDKKDHDKWTLAKVVLNRLEKIDEEKSISPQQKQENKKRLLSAASEYNGIIENSTHATSWALCSLKPHETFKGFNPTKTEKDEYLSGSDGTWDSMFRKTDPAKIDPNWFLINSESSYNRICPQIVENNLEQILVQSQPGPIKVTCTVEDETWVPVYDSGAKMMRRKIFQEERNSDLQSVLHEMYEQLQNDTKKEISLHASTPVSLAKLVAAGPNAKSNPAFAAGSKSSEPEKRTSTPISAPISTTILHKM